jgi:hypothetical protein
MNRRIAFILLILGILSAVVAAIYVESPGYMDADYYYSMGIQWANGRGAEEPFLWNYLSDPTQIPTASHAYWSPLTSMMSGVALRIFGGGFRSAQFPFLFLTAIIPSLVWQLARKFGIDQQSALLAGLLAIFPGFFLPFFVTTDVFILYAFLGIIVMLLLQNETILSTPILWIVIGFTCGLAHLSRADGFLFLVFPIVVLLTLPHGNFRTLVFLILGYVCIMAPWFYRNALLHGSIFGSGGGRTLWLLDYDEIFRYPAGDLSFSRWWEVGVAQILLHRWSAFKVIAQRLLAENGLIFLFPFMLIGIVRSWANTLVRSTTYFLALLLILMTCIFPFAGARGGWFHSSVAAMPMLWVMASVGLNVSVEWIGERRSWNIVKAKNVFRATMVIFAFILTWGLFLNRVVLEGSEWNMATARYQDVFRTIRARDPKAGVVAINNPPGFFHISDLPAVVIPDGDIHSLKQVVEAYNVAWIVLDQNHPEELARLYSQVDILDWLAYEISLSSYGESFVLYRVLGD